ncbi:hypothetical protein PLICRDRAFT_48143 [Plicaturopsis crispa FD-325 SS-3]|nr:hypothetical protein PLICRDRAFT_48143 [Plicaturopsis crispa FD-325 SS-3]
MSQLLATVLTRVTPPPFVNPVDYDGPEYRWRFLVFRPELLKQEGVHFLLLAVLVYVAFIFWGRSYNSTLAHAWYNAHLPLLKAQFSAPEASPLTADGNSDLFAYSTGRRGVHALHTIFTLRPRHDFLQYAFQVLRTLIDLQYRPHDEIELDFKLGKGSEGVHEFVWAVVNKSELKGVKDYRWDLTFTRTTENPALPASLSVMSEFADVTENLLKSTGLVKALSDPDILPYFRSLSVTDQPRARPSAPIPAANREKHVILSLSAPPASAAHATVPLVGAIFAFIDALPKASSSLRPETRTKLRKARDELDKELVEERLKEDREEEEEKKKAAKKRLEEERVSKLSASEQKKILEREKKRAMKKQQGKISRK